MTVQRKCDGDYLIGFGRRKYLQTKRSLENNKANPVPEYVAKYESPWAKNDQNFLERRRDFYPVSKD